YENSASTISAELRGGRACQSARADASRPNTKNVSVKLPRMNAMTSRIEVPPDNAATLATFQCDDPHRITGFAHLRKREPRSGRCPQLHAGSAAAARRTSETLPFLLR